MIEAEINAIVNNCLTTAPGETPLGERLAPFLETATQWFEKTFCNLDIIKEEGSEEEKTALNSANKIIVTEAYRLAVPQLDLVLTANGFATVDSKNVVPASKARTDRLIEGLRDLRDRSIKLLLYRLPLIPKWVESQQAEYFRSTLFFNPEETDNLCFAPSFNFRDYDSSWEKYRAAIGLISDLEESLAAEWFSPELMEALRREGLSGQINETRKTVLRKIKTQISDFFRSGDLKCRRLADIVNFIKKNYTEFPEWVNSETAETFFPPVFRNRKDSAGYFF